MVRLIKNIIIVGPGRAGKTTLARRINEELGYFVFNLDKIIAVFDGAYPELNIRLAWNRDATTENLAPFLGHFLGAFTSNQGITHELILKAHAVEGNRFVLEGGHIDLGKITPILKTYGIEKLKDAFILIGLVQNKKTAGELFDDRRKYDTQDDWTYDMEDGELMNICEDGVSSSRQMTDHLLKHGFTIYDTSFDRERVIERIIEDIKAELA